MEISDQLFRSIIDRCDVGVIVTDKDGRIEYVNDRRLQTSGYTREEVLGANPSLFLSGLTSLLSYEEMWASLLEGHSWKGELLNKRKSGELVREYVSIQPLLDSSGGILGFCAQMVDGCMPLRSDRRQDLRVSILDALTGLPSLPSMMERVGSLLRGYQHHSRGFALLSLDIDGFRLLLESLGRLLADQIIIEVANRLHSAVRREDVVGRAEGDEFIVVLHGDAIDAAVSSDTAKRLLAAIAAPMTIGQHELSLTASIGITYFPLDGSDAETLLGNAALAMLAAKGDGGNRCCAYDPNMRARTISALNMPAQLRQVIERSELSLQYQPKLSLVSGEIVGFEALVRWQHPERGMIDPRRFITVAEETGLIVPLSEWVLRAALFQVKEWREAGLPKLPISVNLSIRNFHLVDLPRMLSNLFEETGVEAKYLELELGESAMMRDPAQSIGVIDRLRALGVQLSLDGFGTGYSSLAYLSRFEVGRLKIDRLFIQDITTNPVDASIVSAMIAMARKLGKKVVAMGVETQAQLNFLQRQGCDEMQGFLFSKPCSADEVVAMLKDDRRLRFDGSDDEERAKSLLLVDDEPNILNALKRLLRRENCKIYTASSGTEALEILALHPVQVVISDQRMPEMSGIELLSKIKTLYPDTVRIILSGYSELGTVTDAINQGAVWKYLSKPWDDELLKDEVRQAFSAAQPSS
ncbi:MAG TPA: EAL domain-containing protein [Rhodocyclaceae bacterium]|nr:EAL domain-containing protein [Rhodocyclaceae bacterium]